MKGITKLRLYLHTLRYLRPTQIWGRILFLVVRAKPDQRAGPARRDKEGEWVSPATRPVSMQSFNRFKFLNVEGEITEPGDWNSNSFAKLWLYNLHYFDDLNAKDARERSDWHIAYVTRWIAENPPGLGNGWEPYPLSLRIINWIKWDFAGNTLNDDQLQSLAIQARFLMQRLEFHILGNHLFVNAKALVFVGCFFSGEEAIGWLRKGLSILSREISEQILDDGGQFERSPMYHAMAYEDMLDLMNLYLTYPSQFYLVEKEVVGWGELIRAMGKWLNNMCHPDGEISFFNDAAIGIAPSPEILFEYANRLGLLDSSSTEELVYLDSSGYIRLSKGEAVLLIDVAPVGPDYLPGHAHADTLSYELSLFGKRVLVNSGTSCYESGMDREWQRSTAAHNTLEVNTENSSEVWASFRVARRAYPFDVSIEVKGDTIVVKAAHDGYCRLSGNPVHHRYWVFTDKSLEVHDGIEGEFDCAVSRLYFHPDIRLTQNQMTGNISWSDHNVRWETDCPESSLESSHWYPAFGLSIQNKCFSATLSSSTPSCRVGLEWS